MVAHAGLLRPAAGEEAGFSLSRTLALDCASVTVAEVIARLGLDWGQVGLVTVDGSPVEGAQVLEHGARVDLYPIFGGG